MPTADNDGVELYYEVSGPEDAETVVFVEGLGYGRWMWRWQREGLADDYRTIVWDNRGTGDSETPGIPWLVRKLPGRLSTLRQLLVFKRYGYTVAEMASDLEAVLADAGVERAHVVGASMGGMIAQEYALSYDRAATVSLLCTSHGGAGAVPTPESTRERMFSVPDGAGEREAIRYKMRPAMTDSFFERETELIERIVDWRLASDASPVAREAQAAGVLDFDASDRLGGIEVPALVVHGTDDRVLPVENGRQLHERLPDSELELFEGGSHLFVVEEADAVTERLRAFFEERG